MINVVLTGLDELRNDLADFSSRRLNSAIATAMTRSAVKARDAAVKHARSVFNNPTDYTIRQLRYVAATAQKPVAAVGFNVAAVQDVFGNVVKYKELGEKTPAAKYLQFQVDGGNRASKRFERALQFAGVLPAGWLIVPGECAKLDAFGNQSVGEIKQIMSWFDAASQVAGSHQNMGEAGREKRRTGTKKKAGFEYFIVPAVGSRRRSSGRLRQPGIYRRTFFAMGVRIEPVMIFVRRASYGRRFDFYGVVKAELDRVIHSEFRSAIDQSRQRLAARGA